MSPKHPNGPPPIRPACCPCGCDADSSGGLSRRGFLEGLGAAALTGLTWSALSAAEADLDSAPPRRALVVKPIFTYSTPRRREGTSWRNWGGVETQKDADQEVVRIKGELAKIQAAADFPVKFLPVAPVRGPKDLAAAKDLASADVVILYAAGGWSGAFEQIRKMGKDMIFFLRHKSGPVYLWYEIISPRYLRQHTDTLKVEGVDFQDVVIDSTDELLWRLRALCGLRNTIGSRIIAIGGPGGWATGNAPKLAQERFKLDIRTVSYKDLRELIKAARADKAAVERSKRRTEQYLKIPGTKLETKKDFVERCFLLEGIFRALMKQADCGAITVNSCMGTIMPASETTACLPLSTLNDDGYLAFCESDFVVVPAGILLGGISGLPTFLNDPTYPHDRVITLAHCTAPRKMDGKTVEPARIMTHFESDYGAAPKVDMAKGRKLTNILPDFAAERWVGLSGEVIDHPLLPICRSQIDIRFPCSSQLLAARMPGFHWMIVYGDWLREAGYALKRVGIQWECLA